jgi:hypothetical protein
MHKSLTEKRIMDAVHREMTSLDNPGFCKACGHEQGGCEPDAQDYECEACGDCAVDGAAELLMTHFG